MVQILFFSRNWERSEGFKASSEFTMKKRELKALVRRTFSTAVFSMLAVVVIAADHLLYRVVAAMREEETISISENPGSMDGLR